ncbi:MAG: DNA (cytosine-5-)-methyltransferase [Clostridium sp.]|nr:DNA (cytosine-5-)-methyltransferase [Clostridium sp.]
MLRVFEAFAGYGSQSIALRNLGIEYEVVAISEIDKYAIKAYEAIHGPTNNLGDICKINPSDIPDHDLFTYSFPCQDLSVAGKQAGLGKGTRSGLLYECEKIIEAKKPKYLLLETVKNRVGKKFKHQYDEWLDYLESLGYTNYWKVLNAKDYGVPQNRERVFVVSILGNHEPYKFADKVPLDKCIADILEDEVDEKYYLSEEIQKRFKITNQSKNIIGTTKPDFRTIGQRDLVYNEEGIMGALVATDYKQPKQILIPQATKKDYIEMDLPGVCDLSYPNSKTRRSRVQEGGKVSPTLTAASQDICYIEYKGKQIELPCIGASRGRNPENPSSRIPGEPTEQRLEINTKGTSNTITTVQKDNYAVEPKSIAIDDTQGFDGTRYYDEYSPTLRAGRSGLKTIQGCRIRKLTPRECFRLMGMRDDDIDKIQAAGISNTQQYKMAGNSIVVNVLEAIFKNLFMEG